jgi:hypothetical protein
LNAEMHRRLHRPRHLRFTSLLSCGWAATACGTAPVPAVPPMVQGGDVTVQVHLSGAGPLQRQDEFGRAAQALVAQAWPGLDRPPLLRRATIPLAPPPGAEVTLRFAISADGYIVHSQLKHLGATSGSAPPASLGMAMLRALPSWRFDPPRQDQRAVGYCCITLVFD